MILEGPGRQLRESQEHKDGGRESKREREREKKKSERVEAAVEF